MNSITINISEAKTNLSKYANLVKKGKTVILVNRNIPFAQIIPLAKTPDALAQKRKSMMGALKGEVVIVGDVNAPLTKVELGDWYNGKLNL